MSYMYDENQNQTFKWIINIMKEKIFVDSDILNWNNKIRGIYGIFEIDKDSEKCLYVGRSINIYSRFFSKSNAHFAMLRRYIKGTYKKEPPEYIRQISTAIDAGNLIKVKILQKLPYIYDCYQFDVQRLASAENYFIDYYQSIGQCLYQIPDGSNTPENDWNSDYNKLKAK